MEREREADRGRRGSVGLRQKLLQVVLYEVTLHQIVISIIFKPGKYGREMKRV